MRAQTQISLVAWLAVACASTSSQVRPAESTPPKVSAVQDDVERQFLADAERHAKQADAARGSGQLEQAKVEDRAAAEGYAGYADRFSGSERRFTMRRSSAERYLMTGSPDKAVEQTQRILSDPQVAPGYRAAATRLSAVAWQMVALAEIGAGKTEKLSLLTVTQRKGQSPKPRPLPESWKRFVAAVDDYLPLVVQESAEATGRPTNGAQAADLALLAAQVEYSHDNLESARERLERLIAAWPSDAPVMELAVPMYLQTFLILGDDSGYDAAVLRAKGFLEPEAKKARESAEGNGGSGGQKKAAEILTRLTERLEQQQQGAGFSQGERLLSAGKYSEAADAFEKFVAQNGQHPDAPSALYNASIAWDRAKQPKRAATLRDRLLASYPDSRIASQALVAQASALSKRGDHPAAEKLYADYLRRWPEGEQRCLALYNRGVEQSSISQGAVVADSFLAFGTDGRCSKSDPKAAAGMLYNAASLYQRAKKAGQAKRALEALLALPPVNDPVVRSWIDDAKRRLKRR